MPAIRDTRRRGQERSECIAASRSPDSAVALKLGLGEAEERPGLDDREAGHYVRVHRG